MYLPRAARDGVALEVAAAIAPYSNVVEDHLVAAPEPVHSQAA